MCASLVEGTNTEGGIDTRHETNDNRGAGNEQDGDPGIIGKRIAADLFNDIEAMAFGDDF